MRFDRKSRNLVSDVLWRVSRIACCDTLEDFVDLLRGGKELPDGPVCVVSTPYK